MIRLNRNNREKYQANILHELATNNKEQFRESYLALHPSDQIDLFSLLTLDKQQQVSRYVTPEEFAIIFSDLPITHQKLVLAKLTPEYVAQMLNVMYTDDTVRLLKQLSQKEITDFLGKMAKDRAERIQTILKYDFETAGSMMTSEYLSVRSSNTVAEVLEKIKREGAQAEVIYYLYVLDEQGILEGIVSLKKVVLASPDEKMEQLMHRGAITIPVTMRQEELGKVFQKYDVLALPVVTEENYVLGIITVDDVMDVVEFQTSKSFAKFSAIKDSPKKEESAYEAAKKRTPWIVFLLFAGMLTSRVITQFEEVLESVVLLAAFMPLLMDAGGNVGTQSLAISVRRLAVEKVEGNNLWTLIKKEVLTGAFIGTVCLASIFLLITFFYQDFSLGLIVGLSLLITLTISSVIGLVLPVLLDKLHIDPAVASGPFITTINDIVGLVVYFSLASFFMNLL